MPNISEEQYRTSLRDDTCVACDRKRRWWGRYLGLFWADCDYCGAHHCRHDRTARRTGNIMTKLAYTWECLYCGEAHESEVDTAV